MHIYLAGPMRGHAQFNFPAFDEAAAQLRALGHTVINPAEADRELGFDETRHDLRDFIQLTGDTDLTITAFKNLAHVSATDCTCMLPGWEQSRGAQFERAAAHYLGRQVRLLSGLLAQSKAHQERAQEENLTTEAAENAEKNPDGQPIGELSEHQFDQLYTGIPTPSGQSSTETKTAYTPSSPRNTPSL